MVGAFNQTSPGKKPEEATSLSALILSLYSKMSAGQATVPRGRVCLVYDYSLQYAIGKNGASRDPSPNTEHFRVR